MIPLLALVFTHQAFATIGAEGTHFTAAGKPIALRGVNLGGWLVEETWMTPWIEEPPAGSSYRPVKDHVSLWAAIQDRLGAAAMLRVRDAWRDNWITDADLAKIKAAGLNHVRLPFLHSILDEPGGLERLHAAVTMCEAAGLYVVLDMHGLPGGQSNEHHTGQEKRNRLWFDVENITEAERDWARVGKEFAGDPGVAAFDLMNEPMGGPNAAMVFMVYDRLYRAVRKTAPHKVILIEDGYKGFETSPHPNLAQWSDVAYSLHFYNFDAKKPEDHVDGLKKDIPKIVELLGYRQTPMYIGEWNVEPFGGPAVIRPYVAELDKTGFSWAFWTWKVAGKNSLGDWGVVRPRGEVAKLNPFTDSEEELIRKIRLLRTGNMDVPPALLAAFNRQ
ncbi:MAG TPA: cellulase family glycosylhydrolase [Fimbriimonadaceae bacterium]|nr:cellulase family glycosylhydrolase [Fimbriimonadaceae bacterium]